MATVIYIKEGRQNPSAMKAVINYCQQEYKTYDDRSRRQLVSGINCYGNNSFKEFMATKKVYAKDNGIFFYHYVQSFSPNEKLSPEKAHEVALEFAGKAWEGHEVLVTTHCDAEHLHSHFVINSVGYETGKKLRQSPSTLKELRKLSDEICVSYGLTVLKPYAGGGKGVSTREYRTASKGDSWKKKLVEDIETAMNFSGSKDEFIRSMSILGYQITWTNERKNLTFHCPNGKKCRDNKLHDDKYLKENIERELLHREHPDREKEMEQPTGWEDSRIVFYQHINDRTDTEAETERTSDSYGNTVTQIGDLAGAVTRIVDNDTEYPEERKKRIEAQENGAAIGTLIGLGLVLIGNSEQDTDVRETDFYFEEQRSREEILREIFESDSYDEETTDDEEDDNTMTLHQ